MLGIKRREVKCLEVGSYAVSLRAQTRATCGLDLKVKPAQINAAALSRALAIFGRRLRDRSATARQGSSVKPRHQRKARPRCRGWPYACLTSIRLRRIFRPRSTMSSM